MYQLFFKSSYSRLRHRSMFDRMSVLALFFILSAVFGATGFAAGVEFYTTPTEIA